MAKYKFSKYSIEGVISHFNAYDATILTMAAVDQDYVAELDIAISADQLEHLNIEYGLVEVQ